MSLVDDLTSALQAGANAGAAAASTGAKDLRQDITIFVVPHLKDIGLQLASIVEQRLAGTYTDATAKALIDSQEDSIQTLVETMVSLAVLEAQTIVNAIVDALNKAVNTALGFTLLA
ncbi:MAG TPA: hypothetical protein VFC56_07255 [Stellaceae bacterium]|nr:hypothetical protein [Stellaceae bacterium]